jgi:hypothetical protein
MNAAIPSSLSDLSIKLGCCALVAVFFIIDVCLPLGIASGIPYITVVFIALWSTKAKTAIYLALICTVMILLGYYFSPDGGLQWQAIANRGLAIYAIWITALLTTMWKRQQLNMESEKQKIYLATIQSSQHVVNNLLNQLQYIKMQLEDHGDFAEETLDLFEEILADSAALMQKLSKVDRIDEDSIKTSVKPG